MKMIGVILLMGLLFAMVAYADFASLVDDPYDQLSPGLADEWFITTSGMEEEFELEYEIKSQTETEFCIKYKDKQEYKQDVQDSGKDPSGVPVTIISGTFNIDVSFFDWSDNELEIEECFGVSYIELVVGMEFKIGWESVEISTGTNSITTYDSLQKNMVRGSDGRLYFAHNGPLSDLWFANSSDDGTTWSNLEIIDDTSITTPGIVINSTDGLLVYWENTSTNEILGVMSSDNGFTWSETIYLMNISTDSFRYPSCIVDSNDVIHCCGITTGNDNLYYTNSSTFGEITPVNLNNNDDSDYCDIEADGNGCVYIVASGTDHGDTDIWGSCLNGWGDTNRIQIHSGASNAYPSLAIGSDNHLYVTFKSGSNVINFANSSDGTTWSSDSIFTDKGRVQWFPEISVNEDVPAKVFIFWDNFTQSTSANISYLNSSDGGLTWNNNTPLFGGGAPNVVQSRFPDSNRMRNILRYVWTDRTQRPFYSNFTINVTAPVAPSDCPYSAIDCSTNPVISEECDNQGQSFRTDGAGTLTLTADVRNFGRDSEITGGCIAQCLGGCFIT